MLLLCETNNVGGERDNSLDLLLGIAEIGVSEEGNNGLISHATISELERASIIIQFLLILPAHSVALLALGGLVEVWEAALLLGEGGKVRSQND